MRVLQIAHGVYPYANAGVEIYTYDLSMELIKNGHEVLIAAHTPDNRDKNCGPGLSIRALPYSEGRDEDVPKGKQQPIRKALAGIIKTFAPEIIHVQHLISLGWDLLADLQVWGIPFIVSLPDYWYLCRGIQRKCHGSLLACARYCSGRGLSRPHEFIYRYYRIRRRLKHCTGLLNRIPAPLVSISHRTADIYCGAGIASDRIVVQPWGIGRAAAQRTPEQIDDGRIRFGYLGSVAKHKGVDVLVKAFLKLRNNSVLKVFGHGHQSFVEELQELAAGAQVYFYGAYDHADLAKILSKFDIAVVPSIWEEVYGLVAQEALAAQKIVIASAVGGLKDRIYHGVNGFLFTPGDHEDLAVQMSYVAENYQELLGKMQFALCHQDLAVDGERFENLYRWTIENWDDLCRRQRSPIEWELGNIGSSLANFLREDQASVNQKLKREFDDPGSSVRRAWTAANPQSDSDVVEFYRQSDSYLYDLLLVHRTAARRRWREIATSLMSKYKVGKLLDYGGGCGDDSLHFARLGIECVLYDISPLNTGYARQRAKELHLSIEVTDRLPEDRKFDGIYCTEMLEHVPEPLDEIRKMSGMLSPRGIVILTHSFDLVGDDYPSHLRKHLGLSKKFISAVEELGFEYLEMCLIPGNKFLVFQKV